MSKLPPWLIKKVPKQKNIRRIQELLGSALLCTVCQSAQCPNIGECFSKNTLTFMILGDVCTRSCRFCAVKKIGQLTTHNPRPDLQLTTHNSCPLPLTPYPLPLDPAEPQSIADAAKKLGLNYVVITSVTRDDLPDGGAGHFAKCITTLKSQIPGVQVEVLVPDFNGNLSALETVLAAGPKVLNHNVETVPRLYPEIRPQADFARSLKILSAPQIGGQAASKLPANQGKPEQAAAKAEKNRIYTKSGFMVGLGETQEEVFALLKSLRDAAVDIVTIGQYLAPSQKLDPVKEFVPPDVFEKYRGRAKSLGFLQVAAGPFVRSSYQAENMWKG